MVYNRNKMADGEYLFNILDHKHLYGILKHCLR